MAGTESDLDKLYKAFEEITTAFGSMDNVLEAFGLAQMPTAQRYGILFGCITFITTISAVACLLVFGGTFERLAEQSSSGEATIPHPHKARAERALLLERLLEARERMSKQYPPMPIVVNAFTSLTKIMMNVHPKIIDNDEKKDDAIQQEIPDGYQQNYVVAYRKCQDTPGGGALSGRPEARYEAYARAFAGCGTYTCLAYRRSYARMYEAICCQNHDTEDKFSTIFKMRPQDIIGKYVRMEALDVNRHLTPLYELTNGEADSESRSYDPENVWSFLEEGPFDNREAIKNSFVFQRKINEAAFAFVDNITDKVVGAVILTNDNPQNLSIQIQPPIIRPTKDGSKEQLEACFLILDKLFALGYRRIEMSIDSQDGDSRKLANRLGFTLEGVLYRHMILKEASRDSNIYSLVNSDWDKGARFSMFKKLHGVSAAQSDLNTKKKEDEEDEKTRVLAEQEAAAKDKNL